MLNTKQYLHHAHTHTHKVSGLMISQPKHNVVT